MQWLSRGSFCLLRKTKRSERRTKIQTKQLKTNSSAKPVTTAVMNYYCSEEKSPSLQRYSRSLWWFIKRSTSHTRQIEVLLLCSHHRLPINLRLVIVVPDSPYYSSFIIAKPFVQSECLNDGFCLLYDRRCMTGRWWSTSREFHFWAILNCVVLTK